jgi:hypothetical protein
MRQHARKRRWRRLWPGRLPLPAPGRCRVLTVSIRNRPIRRNQSARPSRSNLRAHHGDEPHADRLDRRSGNRYNRREFSIRREPLAPRADSRRSGGGSWNAPALEECQAMGCSPRIRACAAEPHRWWCRRSMHLWLQIDARKRHAFCQRRQVGAERAPSPTLRSIVEGHPIGRGGPQ